MFAENRCGAAQGQVLQRNTITRLTGLPINPGAGTCAAAAHSGKRPIATDIANDPGWARLRDLALRHSLQACWSDPILSTFGTILGTFISNCERWRQDQLHRTTRARLFDEDHKSSRFWMVVHLYRIAQEAIHNAIKHGKGRRIVLELAGRAGRAGRA